MISYRKIGGLHWLFIGRFRLAWCMTISKKPHALLLTDTELKQNKAAFKKYRESKRLPHINADEHTNDLFHWTS